MCECAPKIIQIMCSESNAFHCTVVHVYMYKRKLKGGPGTTGATQGEGLEGGGGLNLPTFGQLGPYLGFSLRTYTHCRRQNTHKNMTCSKFLMHFQPFKGIKFHKFSGGACPWIPLAYNCLHVCIQPPLRTTVHNSMRVSWFWFEH